ncbi:MAG TPA: lipid A deacylase LpxR family protein [Pseudoxanthomonas sp.]
MRLRSLSLLAALVTATAPAIAGGLPPSLGLHPYLSAWNAGRLSHIAEIDNDSLLLNRDDGFYTSGLRYTAASSLGAHSAGWRIGQELYTASDINLRGSQLRRGDHPYAAWAYVGVFGKTEQTDGSSRLLGLDLGCLGPCAGGRAVQTRLHKLLNQPLPQAWDTQFKNEAGAMLYGAWTPRRWNASANVDFTPVLQARFGNIHTDASAGLTLRAGQLAPGGVHAVLRMEARAVGYDATLQGGYFNDDEPRAVQPKRLTGELELGVCWQGGEWDLAASVIRRANEVRGLPASLGAQNFVRLRLAYTPR